MTDKNIKIIFLLTVIFFALVVIKKIVDNHDAEVHLKNKGVSKAEIEKMLSAIYDDFNLESSWISKQRSRKSISGSLNYITKIKLPYDLTTLDFVNKLYKKSVYKDLSINVSEEKINGASIIEIKSGDILKSKLNVKQYDNLVRKHAIIGIYLINLRKFDDDLLQTVWNLPINYGCMVQPEESEREIIDSLQSRRIEYSLLLNDGISLTKYNFNPEFSQRQLRKKLNLLFKDFPDAINFVIDDKARIYGSIIYKFLKEEFARANKPINLLSEYISFVGKEKSDVISLLKFNIQNSIGKRMVILLEPGQLLEIEDFLTSIKEKGNKILLPSQMLKFNR